MATIFYPDGTSKEVQPRNGFDFQLDELHEIVGGYIEIVKCKDRHYILVIDDEGKLKGKPRNEQATELADTPNWEEATKQKTRLESMGISVQIIGSPDQLGWIAGTALYCYAEEVQ